MKLLKVTAEKMGWMGSYTS